MPDDNTEAAHAGVQTNPLSADFDATVLITSKNRKEELRRAVASALAQDGCAIEVLVIDDGSEDGTSEMIRSEFPQVTLSRSEASLGLIVQRNRGARLARAPIIVSMDDDATFSTPSVVTRTLQDFDHPRIAAVAIPFVNVMQDQTILQRAPDPHLRTAGEAYIGTAHAVKKSAFIGLGGYREHLLHQCEEEDFCIRLLQVGKLVRLGNADPIHHFESPKRDRRRMVFYNARNHLLFGWHNVPMPYYPIYVLATTFNLLRYGVLHGQVAWTIQGLARGWLDTFRLRRERQPVSGRVYRLSRRLKRRRAMLIDELD
jgi:glycosyltransferase involved in cell wall biosynthesis